VRGVFFGQCLAVVSLLGILLCFDAFAAERPTYRLNQQAVEQMQKGNYLAAIELLKQALAIRPSHEVVRYNMGQSYLRAGEELIKEKKYAAAIKMLESGKEFDDQESRLWLFHGLALLQSNDYFFAETELNEAWAMSGDEPQVLWLLGRLYYHTDRMQDAVYVWERALNLDPQNETIAEQLHRTRQELTVEMGMDKGYGSHFIINYDGQVSASLSNDILLALEYAYDWVGYQLEHYPQRQVPVIVYANRDFKSLTASPDWAAGLYDGKIRLPAGGLTNVNSSVKSLLYHEYMHAVVHELAGNHVPFWLNEGLAVIAGSEHQRPEMEILEQARNDGTLFRWSELETPARQFDTDRVGLAYIQSYDFTRILIEEYGWFQMRELLLALGKGASISEAIDQTLGIYSVDYFSLQKRWAEEGTR